MYNKTKNQSCLVFYLQVRRTKISPWSLNLPFRIHAMWNRYRTVASVGDIDVKYISLNIESLVEDPDKKLKQVVKSKKKQIAQFIVGYPCNVFTYKILGILNGDPELFHCTLVSQACWELLKVFNNKQVSLIFRVDYVRQYQNRE